MIIALGLFTSALVASAQAAPGPSARADVTSGAASRELVQAGDIPRATVEQRALDIRTPVGFVRRTTEFGIAWSLRTLRELDFASAAVENLNTGYTRVYHDDIYGGGSFAASFSQAEEASAAIRKAGFSDALQKAPFPTEQTQFHVRGFPSALGVAYIAHGRYAGYIPSAFVLWAEGRCMLGFSVGLFRGAPADIENLAGSELRRIEARTHGRCA